MPPPGIGVRVADVFEDQWGAIRAAALRRLLVSDGDHVLQADHLHLTPTTLSLTLTFSPSPNPNPDPHHGLQADSYRLPSDLSLRSLAGAEHSIMWTYVMASATHTALDAGCVRMAKYTRRS